MLVQDTHKPNKEPFETSEKGYELLRDRFGDRYQSLDKVVIKPDKIIIPSPKKTAEVVEKGKAKSR